MMDDGFEDNDADDNAKYDDDHEDGIASVLLYYGRWGLAPNGRTRGRER